MEDKEKQTITIAKALYEARKWSFNVMGDEYIEQMHNRTKDTDYGDYAIGKFKMMQKNFGDWYASLDGTHRRRLSEIIYERIAFEMVNPDHINEIFKIDGKLYYLIRIPYTGTIWNEDM